MNYCSLFIYMIFIDLIQNENMIFLNHQSESSSFHEEIEFTDCSSGKMRKRKTIVFVLILVLPVIICAVFIDLFVAANRKACDLHAAREPFLPKTEICVSRNCLLVAVGRSFEQEIRVLFYWDKLTHILFQFRRRAERLLDSCRALCFSCTIM